jgi:predicted transcriptional regulator
MATIVELAAQILSAHVSNTPMSSEDMLQELRNIHASLKALETGEPVESTGEAKATISGIQSIKKNEIICLICNKGGFKTLTRHLNTVHNIKPKDYKKQFGIPAKQSLSAKSLTETRKKVATEKNLAGNLEKARAARAAKKASSAKAPSPAKSAKAKKPSKAKNRIGN